ncbi:MAG TPA: cytochrome c [Vicinamibacteria bacterium]|nr:cytochrome c [Vicinamibacteria bacterium]
MRGGGALLAIVAALIGCRQDMHDQPRYKPLARSEFFSDHRSARPLLPGTVARGQLREDQVFFTGKEGGEFTKTLPLPVSADLLARGRAQFQTFCAPCHGRVGRGDGMVVQRGFRRPPSYHIDRLRETPVGYYFDVITNGFGAMSDYAAQVPVKDRWAIVAYIRALQLSQHATLGEVPAAARGQLQASGP